MELEPVKLEPEAIIAPSTGVPRFAVMAETRHATVWVQAASLVYGLTECHPSLTCRYFESEAAKI